MAKFHIYLVSKKTVFRIGRPCSGEPYCDGANAIAENSNHGIHKRLFLRT